jgi:hypothetical protein
MSNYKIVDGNDIDRENGVVLDYGQDEEINPANLPNANEIMDNVILILEAMDTEEMIKLRNENNEAFVATMENKFETFAERYYSVFRMILSGKDISPLFEMLKVIKKMKSGSMTVERGEDQIGKSLKKFLPEGFEEKLQHLPTDDKKGKKKKTHTKHYKKQ